MALGAQSELPLNAPTRRGAGVPRVERGVIGVSARRAGGIASDLPFGGGPVRLGRVLGEPTAVPEPGGDELGGALARLRGVAVPARSSLDELGVTGEYQAWAEARARHRIERRPARAELLEVFARVFFGEVASGQWDETVADAVARLRGLPGEQLGAAQAVRPAVLAALAYARREGGGLAGWRDAAVEEGAVASLAPRQQDALIGLSSSAEVLARLLWETQREGIGEPAAGAADCVHCLEAILRGWGVVATEPLAQWARAEAWGREACDLMPAEPGLPRWVVELPAAFAVAGAPRTRELVGAVAAEVVRLNGGTTAVEASLGALLGPAGERLVARAMGVAVAAEQFVAPVAAEMPREDVDLDRPIVVETDPAGRNRVHAGHLAAQAGVPEPVGVEAEVEVDADAEVEVEPVRRVGEWPEWPVPAWVSEPVPPRWPGGGGVPAWATRPPVARPDHATALLWWVDRFQRSDFGDGGRSAAELQTAASAYASMLGAGWITQDPAEALERLNRVPEALMSRPFAIGLEAALRGAIDGPLGYARTIADAAVADAVLGGDRDAALAILEREDPVRAGHLICHGLARPERLLERGSEHWDRYVDMLGRGLGACVAGWEEWTGRRFLAALDGRVIKERAIAAPTWAVAAVPRPPEGALWIPARERVGGGVRELVDRISRQVVCVMNAQLGIEQPRVRRPPLPAGVGDLMAEALGGYGMGGCPFAEREAVPEGVALAAHPPQELGAHVAAVAGGWSAPAPDWVWEPAPQERPGDGWMCAGMVRARFYGAPAGRPRWAPLLRWWEERLRAGEVDAEAPTGEVRAAAMHYAAMLGAGWVTRDVEEARVLMGALPAGLADEVTYTGTSPRTLAKVALAGVERGGTGYAMAVADAAGEGRVCHGLPFAVSLATLAQSDSAAAGRLVRTVHGRPDRIVAAGDEHHDRYVELLDAALAACVERWHVWAREPFLAALGGSPWAEVAPDPERATALESLPHPEPPEGALWVPSVDAPAAKRVVDAVSRQVLCVMRSQLGVDQPRVRRPALPDGVGDLLADALGGYGVGGCPFPRLEVVPVTLFADVGAGQAVRLGDLDLDELGRITRQAEEVAAMLRGADEEAGAPGPAGGLEFDGEQAEADEVAVAGRVEGWWAQGGETVAAAVAMPDPGGSTVTAAIIEAVISGGAQAMDRDQAVVAALREGSMTRAALRERFPGLMVDMVVDRLNETSMEESGEVLVLEGDDGRLRVNDELEVEPWSVV